MKRLTFILFFLVSSVGLAQSISVRGSVLDGDYNMEPLAFANVQVKGLDISEETSMDGNFEFNLLEGKYTFVVEFTGYTTVEIKDVLVAKGEVILNPVILSTLRRAYDFASTSNGQ